MPHTDKATKPLSLETSLQVLDAIGKKVVESNNPQLLFIQLRPHWSLDSNVLLRCVAFHLHSHVLRNIL